MKIKNMLVLFGCIVLIFIAIIITLVIDSINYKPKGNSGSFEAKLVGEDGDYIIVEPLKSKDKESLGNTVKVKKDTVSPVSIKDFGTVSESFWITYTNTDNAVSQVKGTKVIDDVLLISYTDDKFESISVSVKEIGSDYIVATLDDESLTGKYGETVKISTDTVSTEEQNYMTGDKCTVLLDKRYVVENEGYSCFYYILSIHKN